MKVLSPPSVERNGAPDELDRMLRAFYKAEMPHPWPATPTTAPRTVLPFRRPLARRPLLRARLALAASVALIALGSWLIPRMFHGGAPADPTVIAGPGANAGNRLPGDPPTVPTDFKIHDSLIQEPGGTTIRVDVIELPKNPK